MIMDLRQNKSIDLRISKLSQKLQQEIGNDYEKVKSVLHYEFTVGYRNQAEFHNDIQRALSGKPLKGVSGDAYRKGHYYLNGKIMY